MPTKYSCRKYPKGGKTLFSEPKFESNKIYWNSKQNTTRSIANLLSKIHIDESSNTPKSDQDEYSETEYENIEPYTHFFSECERTNSQGKLIIWSSKIREQIPLVKTIVPADDLMDNLINNTIEEFATYILELDETANKQNTITKIKRQLILFEDRHISRAYEIKFEEIPPKVDITSRPYYKIDKKLSAADEYFISEDMCQNSVKRDDLIQKIFDYGNFSDIETVWQGTENNKSTKEFYKWLCNNKKSVPKHLKAYYNDCSKIFFKNHSQKFSNNLNLKNNNNF